jgi:hypothetical protein
MGTGLIGCLLSTLLCLSCSSKPAPRHSFERFLYQDKWGRWTFDSTGKVAEENLRLQVMCNRMIREMQEEELIGTDLFAVIGDPKVSYSRLLNALLRLGPVGEQPAFWTRIANDSTYDERHRALCIYELFKRHVHAGMTLGELADMLHTSGKPIWLTEEGTWISALWRHSGTGPLPASIASPYVFSIHPVTMVRVSGPRLGSQVSVRIFLALDRPVDTNAFARLVCHNEAEEPLRTRELSGADVWPPQLVEGELLIERLRGRGVDLEDEVVFDLLKNFVFIHYWPERVPHGAAEESAAKTSEAPE